MGSFPIVETLNRSDGCFRIFDNLPVLFVEDMGRDVTPELLEASHVQMASNRHNCKHEKLTKWCWRDFVNSFRPSFQEKQEEEAVE